MRRKWLVAESYAHTQTVTLEPFLGAADPTQDLIMRLRTMAAELQMLKDRGFELVLGRQPWPYIEVLMGAGLHMPAPYSLDDNIEVLGLPAMVIRALKHAPTPIHTIRQLVTTSKRDFRRISRIAEAGRSKIRYAVLEKYAIDLDI